MPGEHQNHQFRQHGHSKNLSSHSPRHSTTRAAQEYGRLRVHILQQKDRDTKRQKTQKAISLFRFVLSCFPASPLVFVAGWCCLFAAPLSGGLLAARLLSQKLSGLATSATEWKTRRVIMLPILETLRTHLHPARSASFFSVGSPAKPDPLCS